MLTKLPKWITLRWSKEPRTEEFTPFKVCVDFVGKEAKTTTDPVTSAQFLKNNH